MSNVESSIGKVGYRALTGQEVKEIIIHEITKSVRENPLIKRFLTFHNFRVIWGYKITALADTPVPAEIEGKLNVTARDFSDEELAAIRNNIDALKKKREELQPAVSLAALLDKYIEEAEVVVIAKGERADNRRPDAIRREVGLPILVPKVVGGRIAEVPMEDESNLEKTNEQLANEEGIQLSV